MLLYAENTDSAQVFSVLSYDSRDVKRDTLFFCKGNNFQHAFLEKAVQAGASAYVSEVFQESTATAILVTDIQEAMAVISEAFYQSPQKKITVIGITGTKGKTTTSYYLHRILNKTFPNKVGLFSSEETSVDGKHFCQSALTTPESLLLYRQLSQAVQNGLTHVVMEVSSQAYKNKRVFGITFDIGIFLNISPDHISPIEHATFEEYFDCKKQLLDNSKYIIFNQESLVKEDELPDVHKISYGRDQGRVLINSEKNAQSFTLTADKVNFPNESFLLSQFGAFNHENATAAILASRHLGSSFPEINQGLSQASIPGRMNLLRKNNGAYVFVDYAHNYVSVLSIGQFAKSFRPNGRLIFVTGSVGGKALSRRSDIGKALNEVADVVYLTSDDPDAESAEVIAYEIQQAIANPDIICQFNENRKETIKKAIQLAEPNDTVLLIGKGMEKTIKLNGKNEPYDGDYDLAQQYIERF